MINDGGWSKMSKLGKAVSIIFSIIFITSMLVAFYAFAMVGGNTF